VHTSALWARGFEQDFATTGGWGIRCGSAGQRSQAAAGWAQQSSVRALPKFGEIFPTAEIFLELRDVS